MLFKEPVSKVVHYNVSFPTFRLNMSTFFKKQPLGEKVLLFILNVVNLILFKW